jgi:hypothetical protein
MAALTQRRGAAPECVGIIVHGSSLKYKGNLGIHISGPSAEAWRATLNVQLVDLGLPPLERVAATPNVIHMAELGPLLVDLDEKSAAKAGASYSRFTAGSATDFRVSFNVEHAPLLLVLLRRLCGPAPVFIVGAAMLRRCVSLVAVDYLGALGAARPTTLAVTHMLLSASQVANGADTVQQVGRCATTLVDFHKAHGFDKIQVLASPIVWDFIRGGVAFNQWLGAGLSRDAVLDMLQHVLSDVTNNVRTLAEAVIFHMDVPQSVLNYMSQRNFAHARAHGPNRLAGDIIEAALSDDDEGGQANANEPAMHRALSMEQLRRWLQATHNNAGMGVTSAEYMRRFDREYLRNVDGSFVLRDDGSPVVIADSIANQLRNWSTRMSDAEQAALHLRREGGGVRGDPYRYFCTLPLDAVDE